MIYELISIMLNHLFSNFTDIVSRPISSNIIGLSKSDTLDITCFHRWYPFQNISITVYMTSLHNTRFADAI